ncbi:helix-turn-helix transcriptional regulator [Microvirga sp. 2MCAF35]|uniref:helix-turn-helix transcriptional regulator n=1 Tax=Microvirga sp. 2MCAF35 TaxID=3232987 RepID=UPI003F968FC8
MTLAKQFNTTESTRVRDPMEERFLTEKEVAHRQGRSVKTLQNQRVSGGGIPFLKLGGAVRYRLSDVIAWEESCFFLSTSSGPSSKPKTPDGASSRAAHSKF